MTLHKYEITYQHGWGFSGKIWENWQKFTPDYFIRIKERGYFTDAANKDYRDENDEKNFNARQVVISHSYGLHLLSETVLEKADMCVIFGGFEKLMNSKTGQENKHDMLLNSMVYKFQEDPFTTLKKFYRNVFFPDEIIFENNNRKVNCELLLSDLKKMLIDELNMMILKKIPRTIIFHGKKDRIVPVEKGRELHEKIPNSSYFVFENAGHALPFTNAAECWKIISKELEF